MITLKQAQLALDNLETFNAGNLMAFNDGHTYAVYSYQTLIANRWLDSGRGPVWLTDQKYSVTTSKHLNIVKRAWGIN